MSISAFLEVAIGLVFTYLLLSWMATGFNEWLASVLKLRAEDLKKAIGELLQDPKKVEEFYEHPLIKSLGKQKNGKLERLPSYIPDRKFAVAALDVLSDKKALVAETADEVRGTIDSLPPSVKDTFDAFWRAGAKNVESLRSDAETWFNDKMDRLGGYYKRRAQWVSLIIGLVLAVGLNIDTVAVADGLYRDPVLRASVVEYAEASAQEYAPGADTEIPVDKLRETLESLEIPMGWGEPQVPTTPEGWVLKVVGWLLTGLAVSQGAPFWFDALKKLVNIRSSGAVPKVEKGVKELEDKLKEVTQERDELKKLIRA